MDVTASGLRTMVPAMGEPLSAAAVSVSIDPDVSSLNSSSRDEDSSDASGTGSVSLPSPPPVPWRGESGESGRHHASDGGGTGGAGGAGMNAETIRNAREVATQEARAHADRVCRSARARATRDGTAKDPISFVEPHMRALARYVRDHPEVMQAAMEAVAREDAGAEMDDEWVLTEHDDKYVAEIPERSQALYEHFKKQEAQLWTVEELTFESDRRDWELLNDDERHFIKQTLAFFASSDGIVNENIEMNFCSEVQDWAARAGYGMQMHIENIHGATYNELLRLFVPDRDELRALQRASETMPYIREKAEWAKRYIEAKHLPFAYRLVAFVVVEGIFFSSSFASIFWMKKRGLLPGLAMSNEFISRDEAMHVQQALLLYKTLKRRVPEHKVYEMVRDGVERELQFVESALPSELIGMNSAQMKQYVMFVADYMTVALGYDKLYNVENPFPWMTLISLSAKSNFFEKRPSEYALASVGSTAEDRTFRLDADF